MVLVLTVLAHNTELSELQQQQLRHVLLDNADVLGIKDDHRKLVTFVKHDIDTEDNAPIGVRPFRASPKEIELQKTLFNKNL